MYLDYKVPVISILVVMNVMKVKDDLRRKKEEEEKNEKLQVQPNWRSGQIVQNPKWL
jgi:hypothetical protein